MTDRIDKLEKAQNLMREACCLIEEALDGTTHEAHADAYLLGHLRDMSSYEPTDRNCSIAHYIENVPGSAYDEEAAGLFSACQQLASDLGGPFSIDDLHEFTGVDCDELREALDWQVEEGCLEVRYTPGTGATYRIA
jgi:hypothetical protein